MKNESSWQEFTRTGSIEAYLRYRGIRMTGRERSAHENSTGRSDIEGTEYGKQ